MDPTQWNVPFPVIVAALLAIVSLRAGATYWFGRLAASGVRKTRMAHLMESRGYLRATRLVNEYGAPMVAVSFLTIGFQTLANAAAGATRMPLRRYLPALLIGGTCWALIYATIGVVGADLFSQLFAYSPGLAIGALVFVIGAYVAFVIWRTRRSLRSTDSEHHPV